MLKTIPEILPPKLLKILMEMATFRLLQLLKSSDINLVYCNGHNIPEILEAFMQLFPLEKTFTKKDSVAFLMGIEPHHKDEIPIPERWQEYKTILQQYEPSFSEFAILDRFAFYDRARLCYAIVATNDKAIYTNIIIKKGVL